MKNFKKIFLWIITTVLLLFWSTFTLASWLEPYYKCPNCTENDNNCTCYYNSTEKCYCEYYDLVFQITTIIVATIVKP